MKEQTGTGPDQYHRLPRVKEGRMIVGVCGGLGRYTGIDPVVYRVGFALLCIMGGLGVPLYVVAALMMPPASGGDSPAEQVLRRRFDAGGVLVVLGGLLAFGALLGLTGSGLLGLGLSGNVLTAITVFTVALLVAHARGVDLREVARTLPERLQGHPPVPATGKAAPSGWTLPDWVRGHPPASGAAATEEKASPPLPPGMIDLARLGEPGGNSGIALGISLGKPDQPLKPPQPPKPVPPKPKSVLAPVTLLLAMIAAAAVVPVASGYAGLASGQIITATGLLVVGLGLVVATLYGRSTGLVAVGTVLSLGLVTSAAAAGVEHGGRVGEVEWRPVDATKLEPTYRLALGAARLDLTALPLRPGQRVRVQAELTAGELIVTLPPGARVEADLRAGLGDLEVEKRVVSGPKARFEGVLEPEGRPVADPPVIELHVRGKLGNVEVRRA
ncbi:hypothetical protein DPM19_10125 [Actinomadura craniellae]|uniref:Phage shock protein PspC N-terminal domain-containing protein n=1 Tax=Actinomadura craniellae TaxID=2231787 RepID=A0A365H7M5_9ACTN|nr:PspC domain-containing protein [Actinomadura craniellae]RAY15081.1 hypothetical protein DPM19_10125 [Actinomadura craniellae]